MGLKIFSSWRAGVAAVAACLVLIGCGGGGGGGGDTSITPPVVLEGNWRFFVTSEGVQTDTGIVSPAKDVPTAQAVSQLTVADFSGALVPVTVGGYTVNVNGSTITITGPNTNYTVTVNSFSVTNYQSCGACGVGSEVSFQLDVNVTEGGTFDGNVVPKTTNSGSGVLKWVRVN